MKNFALAAILLLAESAPAPACIDPPEAIRAREIALFDSGLRKSKLAPADIAKAEELRDRAEALFKAGKLDEARDGRHAALVQIGYRYEETESTAGLAPGSVPVIGLAPKSAVPKHKAQHQGVDTAARDCGGGGSWVPPAQ